jgi:hypothetical protein
MKKLSAILVGMSLVAGAVMAAGPVTSVNVVGYVKKDISANQYVMLASPFTKIGGGDRNIYDVLGTNGIPNVTQVLLWDGSQYATEIYYDGYGWDPGTTDVSRADGFWVIAPEGSNLVFSGEVPSASTASNTTTVLTEGYQLIAFPYPVTIALTNTALAAVGQGGDMISAFNGVGYDTYVYYDGYGWDPADLVFQPGVGYWYYRYQVGSVNWIEPIPYSL